MGPILEWQPLLQSDLDLVNEIADRIHTSLPERSEVFAEKVRLFPSGCRKLVIDKKMVGYGISHPWILYAIPPLDEFLVGLPARPECIYIHDVVVLPEARGQNAAGHYIDYLKALAAKSKLPSLALVSVYGTDVLWSRYGFQVVQNDQLDRKLKSYGATAKYMIWTNNA
jgi:ribosomal protein S18 acetylase RimI-like enzyme